MDRIVFDIETIPWFKNNEHRAIYVSTYKNKTLKDPEKLKENEKKILADASLRPISGQIVMGGILDSSGYQCLAVQPSVAFEDPLGEMIVFENEKLLVDEILKKLADGVMNGKRICTFNGKEFDLPFLMVRAIYHDLPAYNLPYDKLINKYNHSVHLDMKNFFDKGGLNEIANILDLGELSDSGADLPALWLKDPMRVMKKNKEDVEKLNKLIDRSSQWIPQRMSSY
jgi:DNA polymerase elongation subunit (family B)